MIYFIPAWFCSQLHAHIIIIIIIIDMAPAYWQETSYIYIYIYDKSNSSRPGNNVYYIDISHTTHPLTHSPTHYSLTFPPSLPSTRIHAHIVGSPWPRGAPSQSHSTEQNKTRKK
ncbi:no significant blast hit [Histoplasma capsulatum var. duboisii H88]|uniref:No significant blast hit n=1 Tax=Ajellomyces capsulatus (strain H88) TaxID=544711 RepID=A0A8A1LVR1_AJEC8|nr:no significant blast hit [Histoplasma capsulatum var. duboisii H88]